MSKRLFRSSSQLIKLQLEDACRTGDFNTEQRVNFSKQRSESLNQLKYFNQSFPISNKRQFRHTDQLKEIRGILRYPHTSNIAGVKKTVKFSENYILEEKDTLTKIVKKVRRNKIRLLPPTETGFISYLRETMEVYDTYSLMSRSKPILDHFYPFKLTF